MWQQQQVETISPHIEVINKVIETTTTQWHYCLTFDINAEIMGKVPEESELTAEAIVEVESGAVGIAWIDPENHLASPEQVVQAKAGVQRVIVVVGSDKAHRLMLRNVAPNGRKATFTLKSLSATATAILPAVPAASSDSGFERRSRTR